MFFHLNVVNRLILCSSLLLMPIAASAQRTASGHGMVSLSGSYPWGAELSYGQYLPSSFWEAGAQGLLRSYPINQEISMKYAQVFAYGDWMYRLAATRNRLLNLYLGAGAFLGYESYDPWKQLPSHISSDVISKGTFLYGILGKLQIQIFMNRYLSLLLTASAPVNFASPITWIQPSGSLGLRLDL